jgi:hypothetical protein
VQLFAEMCCAFDSALLLVVISPYPSRCSVVNPFNHEQDA